ncbi:MAG: leucine-rich repeat domain-containing protein, partial [Oscillospiraceae bacterium]|nr:leucine-rich repeat domain-containing protein [Oscillospiraceae bacterium]
IELSKGLVEINFWSFRECRSLKELVIPETVKTIMGNCFEMCGIEKIHIPDTIEDIDQLPQRVTNFEEPFIKNGNLLYVPKDIVSYEIPYGVKRICINAFANCQKLEQVIIPDTVKDICYDAFRECSSLHSVRVPDSVEMLDMGVFGYCTALEEIVLPSKLEIIKSFTFNKCTKLKSVRLSRKTQVEQFAFCDSTEIIYVD